VATVLHLKGPGNSKRESEIMQSQAEAQAKQPGVRQPGANFSSRRCVDIELGILLP
jgi:hypothetical protein